MLNILLIKVGVTIGIADIFYFNDYNQVLVALRFEYFYPTAKYFN